MDSITSTSLFNNNNNNNEDTNEFNYDNNIATANESQLVALEQFLFKSSRYSTDQIFQKDGGSNRKRLLLIKEIPNSAYYNLSQFQVILRKYMKYSKSSPLCFSFNLNTNSSWDTNPYKLFTNELKQELKIYEINFNAFANSFLIKALNRIIQLEGGMQTNITKDELNDLCVMCNGDLRYAINCLEFYFIKKRKKLNSSQTKSSQSQAAFKTKVDNLALKFKTKSFNGDETDADNGKNKFKKNFKDSNLNLFKGLGKILHRKNYDANNDEDFTIKRFNELNLIEENLPKHLLNKYRPPLHCNPEEVYSKLSLSSESIVLFLNQNYLEMLSERSFHYLDSTLNSIVDISENFCYADMLQTKNSTSKFIDFSNRGSIEMANEISALFSMRSMLFNLYLNKTDDAKTQSANKGVWKPLYKPYYTKVNETIKLRKQKALDLFLYNENNGLFKLHCTKNEFFQEYLPFLLLNYNTNPKYKQKLSNEQRTFISSMLQPINLTNNNKNFKNSANTTSSIFSSSMRFGQNDVYLANDDDDCNEANTMLNGVDYMDINENNSKIVDVKNHLYDYDDNVNITDFKF